MNRIDLVLQNARALLTQGKASAGVQADRRAPIDPASGAADKTATPPAAKPSARTAAAQAALAKRQVALAADIQAALAKARTPLKGTLAFTVDGAGALQVAGDSADRAALAGLLRHDKSRPPLAERLQRLTADAQGLATAANQQALMMRAARSASNPRNVLALYEALQQQVPQGPGAVFRLGQAGSAIAYPGMLQLRA